MPFKKKNKYQLKKAFIRLFTICSIIFVIWFSIFWADQKHTFHNPQIIINGALELSDDYYKEYLLSSIEIKDGNFDMNNILDELFKHPYIEVARSSYRYPNIILVEISERVPFAIVNNSPMIMIDKNCFVLPNINNVNNYSIPILSKYNSAPELYPIGKQALSVKVKDTISWLKTLKHRHPDLYNNISEITLENEDEIMLILAENPTKIMLGNKNTLYKIEVLKKFEEALNRKKIITDFAYLDMRYKNQVIVKER